MDTIIVEQRTGRDSMVIVRREDTVDFMQRPVSTLYFESDQYLDTESERARNVGEAIEKYARERGYRLPRRPTGRTTTQAVYDRCLHSGILTSQIFEQIKEDARFERAVETATVQKDKINGKYAPTIAQLKQLIFRLEHAQEAELAAVRDTLKRAQVEIAQGMKLPDELDEIDRGRLLEPKWPLVKVEAWRPHTKKLPDLERVAWLMNELE